MRLTLLLAAVLACACWPAAHAQDTAPAPAPGPDSGACNTKGEAAILLNLFKELGGFAAVYKHQNFTGWDLDTPVCQWGGLTCNAAGQVENVTIQGNGWLDADGLTHINDTTYTELSGNASAILLQLAKLPALRAIRLPFHSLRGTLPGPEFFERASKLEELYLPYNLLSGPIPANWTPMSLRRLNLQSGYWNGTLPFGWGKDGKSFQKLELLHISHYPTSDPSRSFNASTIPSDWPAQLPAMKSLIIDSGNLTGPLPVSLNTWNLTLLDLEHNALTGSLPPQFAANGTFPALKYLGLSSNNFTGTIPNEWGSNGALASLETLRLRELNLTGPLPSSWLAQPPALPKLRELKVGETEICGAAPANVTVTSTRLENSVTLIPCNETSAKGANSANSEYTRGVLLGLKSVVPNFEEVFAAYNMTGWKNDSSDYCKWSLVGCTRDKKLTHFTMNLNKTSEQEFEVPDPLISHIDLTLWKAPAKGMPAPVFKGNIGAVLLQLTKLRLLHSLDISNNRFEGELPGAKLAQQAQYLEFLFAANNSISGRLPSGAEWAFPNLKLLILDRNSIQGSLPADWGSNSTRLGSPMLFMNFIQVAGNKLDGSLPASWGERLGNLTGVDLSDNKIAGSLPDKWFNLTSLKWLKLARNQISGALPSTWGDNSTGFNMATLRNLNAANNTLTGTLPAAWGYRKGMRNLQFLNLAGNLLRGSIPSAWNELNATSLINTTETTTNLTFPVLARLDLKPGNPGLCGAVPYNLTNTTFKAEYEVHLGARYYNWRPLEWSSSAGALVPSTYGSFVNTTQAQNETLTSYGPCPSAGPNAAPSA